MSGQRRDELVDFLERVEEVRTAAQSPLPQRRHDAMFGLQVSLNPGQVVGVRDECHDAAGFAGKAWTGNPVSLGPQPIHEAVRKPLHIRGNLIDAHFKDEIDRRSETENAGQIICACVKPFGVIAPVTRSTRNRWMPRPLPGGRSTWVARMFLSGDV